MTLEELKLVRAMLDFVGIHPHTKAENDWINANREQAERIVEKAMDELLFGDAL